MGLKYSHLSDAERWAIETKLKERQSLASIGRTLGRHRSVAGAGRGRALQAGHIRRDRGEVGVGGEVLRIGEVLHAQVGPTRRAEVPQSREDDRGRLTADRRDGTVCHAAAIGAVAGRAIAVQARPAVR